MWNASRHLRRVQFNAFPVRGARGQSNNRDSRPVSITAALVLLIQLLGGKGKGEVREQGIGNRGEGMMNSEC